MDKKRFVAFRSDLVKLQGLIVAKTAAEVKKTFDELVAAYPELRTHEDSLPDLSVKRGGKEQCSQKRDDIKKSSLRVSAVRGLKCPYDQIFDLNFITFSCTIRPSYSSCQISIHYEHQKSFYFNIYFREFTAALNQPCSKAWLRMGESDVKDSNIPHGLKL